MDDLPVGLVDTGNLYYVEPDHLGTPRAVIDPTRNVAVWRWDLNGEAFGNTAPNEDPDLDSTNFVFNLRYPGQRYDSATGLNYNYFRDYDKESGRYVESDPFGLFGGNGTFTYGNGNPFINVDPNGQWVVPVIVVVGAGGAVWLFKHCMEKCTGVKLPKRSNCPPIANQKFSKCATYCFNLAHLFFFASDPLIGSAEVAGEQVGGGSEP